MEWFQNKKKKRTAEALTGAGVNPAAAPEHTSNIRGILDEIMANAGLASGGVVLKLYLENFKHLNKIFGYDYCEKLLCQITAYLTEAAGGCVYRHIGVEFIIILEQFSEGRASDLADELLDRFGHVWTINGIDCLCSAQIGLCSYPGHALTTDELLKRLDQAVSSASDCGPNQLAVYDSAMHNQFLRRQSIALYLQSAIEKDEIEVRYRPTFNLKEGRFTRADFYMRVFIQGIGLVGAGEFLPIAEDSGQIRTIGYYSLEQVGRCIADLMAEGKEFDSICVPVSPILCLQENFLEQVGRILETYKIPSGRLALELDESALGNAYLNINIIMQELSDLGVELVLNGFGSGYTPISSLLELPVQTLKLERLFVWQLETNPRASCIFGGLIHIARSLGLHIIAEGVETENQLNALNQFGCEYQQGFYYAPTMNQDTLMKVIGTTLDDSRITIEEEKLKMKR